MAVMQRCIKAEGGKKAAANLLDISGKLTVKNYHCHLLSSSLEIAAVDLCTQTDICLGVHVSVREGEREDVGEKDGKKKDGSGSERERRKKYERQSSLFLLVSICVWACVYVRNLATLCMFECVKTVQRSHPAHIAPGLYPSNCRSQSDIVLLWLLSMVLHISPEMTKSLSQCP